MLKEFKRKSPQTVKKHKITNKVKMCLLNSQQQFLADNIFKDIAKILHVVNKYSPIIGWDDNTIDFIGV